MDEPIELHNLPADELEKQFIALQADARTAAVEGGAAALCKLEQVAWAYAHVSHGGDTMWNEYEGIRQLERSASALRLATVEKLPKPMS